jgi:hypothetical protein
MGTTTLGKRHSQLLGCGVFVSCVFYSVDTHLLLSLLIFCYLLFAFDDT